RRQFLKSSAVGLATVGSGLRLADVPVRALTKGHKFHWFGYYDKHQFDPTGRYILGMQVDFERRRQMYLLDIREALKI
ncbi:MAG: twin-arginine translocation signal domain-containing protein, partial [Spirosomaceae bacterium]|nr:twin-arginine translocation signal domain-containing protein [Spirosomataceae bacterium]